MTNSRWENFKSNFGFFTGVTGLIADTLAILGAIGANLILPSVSSVKLVSAALDTILLLTALFGLYSLTMIAWFLFKRRRSNQGSKTFGFDDFYQGYEDPIVGVVTALIPFMGPFMVGMVSYPSMRNIFWLAVFISLLPATLWLYLLSTYAVVGCFAGLLGSFLLSQYATFFALLLDKFFESNAL